MAKKKDDKQQLSAEELLEARVDAMMDPRPAARPDSEKPADEKEAVPAPDEATAHTEAEAVEEDLPPLDIFADSKGAPSLPKNLKTVPEKAATDGSLAKDTAAKADKTASANSPTPTPEADSTQPSPEAETPGNNKPATTGTQTSAGSDLDDAKSDAAVDDIVAQEGDVVLAAEDAGVARAHAAAEAREAPPKRTRHPIFWLFITLLIIVGAVFVIDLVDPNLLNV